MRRAFFPNVSIILALVLAHPFASAAQTVGATPPPAAPVPTLFNVPPAWSEPIDPLMIDDEDFARHRDPKEWAGLSVRRLVFSDGEINWSVWRIVNELHRDGPLWVLPHDNENATFGAALIALRRYGGIVMAIDDRAGRMNYDAASGASLSTKPP